ncbi:methyltransferase domain-containing protein [Candidatus Omnitrophota bacterium]
MFRKTYDQIKSVQDSYFFYNNRRFLLKNYLNKISGQKQRLKILDLGTATGAMLDTLAGFGATFGLDLSEYALQTIKNKNCPLLRAGAEKLPFKSEVFDLVVIFDLLYHKDIRDEQRVVAEIYRVLKKGGSLLVTDSAFMHLYGRHDQAAQGVRRFNKQEMINLLSAHNFKVIHFTYIYMVLFPLIWFKRRILAKLINNKDVLELEFKETFQPLNLCCTWLFNFEFLLSQILPLPFGVSFSCWAKK